MDVHRQFRECELRDCLFDIGVNLPGYVGKEVLVVVTRDLATNGLRINRQIGVTQMIV